MKRISALAAITTFFASSLVAFGIPPETPVQSAPLLDTFTNLPIKEVTVFKDGHAFVAHEGELPTDRNGNVVMDYLPTPVIGTFWPYSANARVKLKAVTAGQRRVLVEHTALTLREMLEANIGEEVIISESGGAPYNATIVDVPMRTSAELAATAPPGAAERLPAKGNIILLKTPDGVKVVNIEQIQQVTFRHDHRSTAGSEEFRNTLTLHLDWGRSTPSKTTSVGLMYLQKGVRWIPSYKVEIDGQSNAVVRLQATLINELADLDDAAVNLVIGVPSFAFKDTIDPMALQQSVAQLSSYFQGSTYDNSPIASNFSNGIMTQAARMGEYRAATAPVESGSLGPDIGDSGRNEDLFVFRVEHVTLRKGERMVLPIAVMTLPYRDVFTLELPFAPPPEMRGNLNSEQQRELARLLGAPKVMHKIRLVNSSQYPLTTAPALIVRDGRVLGQGMMTYTAIGADSDLPITAAVEIQAKKSDVESKRTPNAVQQDGYSYWRVDMSGKVTLTSRRPGNTEIEVTRYVLGMAGEADHSGKTEQINAFENPDYVGTENTPYWWGWYSWPNWWSHFNGIGRVTWTIQLERNQTVDLGYQWHYFWR